MYNRIADTSIAQIKNSPMPHKYALSPFCLCLTQSLFLVGQSPHLFLFISSPLSPRAANIIHLAASSTPATTVSTCVRASTNRRVSSSICRVGVCECGSDSPFSTFIIDLLNGTIAGIPTLCEQGAVHYLRGSKVITQHVSNDEVADSWL